jgi:hypothetical protein
MTQDDELSTNLTIGDLKTIASIIDVTTTRGAFKPNELVIVGTLFEKITGILATVEAQIAQNEDQGNKEAGN